LPLAAAALSHTAGVPTSILYTHFSCSATFQISSFSAHARMIWVLLFYENGQHCWNGPHRSTQIILACAEKDEIWKVAEQEKCVYRMEVGTPAVCESAAASGKAAPAKDEL